MDAALQRELADSFVYAMPKILFESIFWHVVKKIAKRKVYINVNFLDMFFQNKICPFWVKYDVGELARNRHTKAVYVLQEHLKTDFSLKEVCLCVCIYANIKMLQKYYCLTKSFRRYLMK